MTETSQASNGIEVSAELSINDILTGASPAVREMVALSMALSTCMATENQIIIRLEQSLLDLALTTNSAMRTLAASNTANGKKPASRTSEEEAFTPLVRKLKTAAQQFKEAVVFDPSRLPASTVSTTKSFDEIGSKAELDEFHASALGVVYRAAAHALALSMQNAVAAQQELNALGAPILAKAISLLFSVDTDEADECEPAS
jgi:hypothetical protein